MAVHQCFECDLHGLSHAEIIEGFERRLFGVNLKEHTLTRLNAGAHEGDDPVGIFEIGRKFRLLFDFSFSRVEAQDFLEDDEGGIACWSIHGWQCFPIPVDPITHNGPLS